MSELPRQFLAWIASLLPTNKNKGDGGFQVGKISGPVTVVNVFGQLSPENSGPQPVDADPGIATPTQREVLRLLRGLSPREREAVLLFMERTFQTRMVIDLRPAQQMRVRKYIEAIQRRQGTNEKAMRQ